MVKKKDNRKKLYLVTEFAQVDTIWSDIVQNDELHEICLIYTFFLSAVVSVKAIFRRGLYSQRIVQ